MKKILSGLLLCLLVVSVPAFACSSFVVYFDEPIYGMNLDINSDIKIMLDEDEDSGLRIFSLYFSYRGACYGSNLVMTSKGQFRCLQEQYPLEAVKKTLGAHERYIGYILLHHMLAYDLDETLAGLEGIKLVQPPIGSGHILFADVDGKAAIIEVGKDKNEIISMVDDFLVMTNFKNSDFRDVAYDQIEAVGSERYQAIYKYILNNRDNFNLASAFEALSLVATGITKCSMVFVPGENNIYFALNGSFEKLWRLSLTDKTIYTFKGFAEPQEYPVPREGIAASYLLEIVRKDLLE